MSPSVIKCLSGTLNINKAIMVGQLDRKPWKIPDEFDLELPSGGTLGLFEEVEVKELWMNMKGDIRVINTHIGREYLKLSIDILKLLNGWSGRWDSLLNRGSVKIFHMEQENAPVLIVMGDYYSLIAPRVV